MVLKLERKQIRLKRVRIKIFGTHQRPRLSVYRSNKRISAQVIDDSKGITIAAATDQKIADKLSKTEKAKEVGQMLAEKLVRLGIKTVVFDRNGYKYHGRVKALAEGVRQGGVVF